MKRPELLSAIISDLIGFATMATAALLLGLTVNALRHKPLMLFPTSQEVAGSPLSEVTLSEFQQEIQNHEAYLIDVRPADFFALGHIPGAISLPLAELQRQTNPEEPALTLSKDRSLIVYCADVSCPVAHSAARILQTLGYRHVKVFPGGWYAWKKAGLPIEGTP